MYRVYSNILMIATKDKSEALRELPVRLFIMDTAKEALACLRTQAVDSVVSQWDLVDMPGGTLLEKIIDARPNMPTVAFIEPGNWEQEITARSMGVTAILSDDIDENYFRNTICQILHIESVSALSLAGKIGS
jgi:DNA-binding NtrC family response regulator